MRYINFLLIMFIALAFGCSKQDSSIIESIEPTLYTVGFADQQTRTFVNDDINLLWHESDKLSVFDKSTLNRQFVFQGKTGASSGAFKYMNSDMLQGIQKFLPIKLYILTIHLQS